MSMNHRLREDGLSRLQQRRRAFKSASRGGDVVNVLVDEVTAPHIYSSVSGEEGGYCVTL